ncbi:hypothetical protein PHYBLDRAFT_178947 [Phycomyces blakesleeanus NRRL 1555(-)]|uniref:Uncharacterized protein n=1 Tax=Phycomyces blakesleeanus (strain ATCC 8743b / DSM 1359 / FGSC 10004 / NBRC 33097 / NRRL 1555) TaxID=763407 RepID=A0A162QAU7_PHYB8|nr:hypothetical protein PHYBLDRAFT_178946 [Phycomyces blakesleeanus NRRL 1555(-)]XP_018299526.1 hypothetical protein PHYBLDRAFT_178947 [Phycomyces blakesleeanus NRRL 1555(-)]OAD81483.1 hypothetical protein PHYBLDRAFT_178946 [Phycomyces blakesleeanus NRRL 1555(-)]OAD81486.1 hypothetical protein PHYBLDRAFT_178947 [Phycomyces blakesleeanus NRRL 1555(-)]|eukprot:XP_018299523.1 hypothetical protein PHYBLDRAFT_178946 [Phycomyces blakesleeanus NRRL 1555(-)]
MNYNYLIDIVLGEGGVEEILQASVLMYVLVMGLVDVKGHCLSCNYIGEEGGVVKDKFPVRIPDGVNRDGGNLNLEKGGNGGRKPSTSEKPGNVRNGPGRTHLPPYQCPHGKLARAGEDEMLERVHRRDTEATVRTRKERRGTVEYELSGWDPLPEDFPPERTANSCYIDILSSRAFKSRELVKNLLNRFKNWKESKFEESFWAKMTLDEKKKADRSTIANRRLYNSSSFFSASSIRITKNSEELFSANSPEHLDDLAVSSSQQHESQPNSFTDTSTDSYIDEGDISDDSQSVEAGDVFDFLSTTEGVYDVSVPSITKSWKVVSGFNVSESFLQYRETCIEKAKTHRNLETHEELALSGIMLIDDSICEEHYFPFEHVEDVLQDIEAVDYFHIPNADEEESRLCQKFAYNMQQRRLNYDHVDRILDDIIYCMNYSIHPINEATLVHNTINVMIDAYFKNSPIIKCLNADNMSFSSSARFTNMDPSLVNHNKRPDFSIVSNREKHLLLTLEAKRCGRSMSGDFFKLAKLLKDSLNQIEVFGIVYGLVSQ